MKGELINRLVKSYSQYIKSCLFIQLRLEHVKYIFLWKDTIKENGWFMGLAKGFWVFHIQFCGVNPARPGVDWSLLPSAACSVPYIKWISCLSPIPSLQMSNIRAADSNYHTFKQCQQRCRRFQKCNKDA